MRKAFVVAFVSASMDGETRIRFVGVGLQVTLLGGFAAGQFGDAGLLLVMLGTIITGWGVT